MYLNNKHAIKIGDKQMNSFTQGRGMRQGCSLSLTLFNRCLNELANLLEQLKSPDLTVHDSKINFFCLQIMWLCSLQQRVYSKT